MSGTEQALYLDRIFEFVIFVKKTLFIFPEKEKELGFHFTVHKSSSNLFTAKISTEETKIFHPKSFINKPLIASLNYRGKELYFPIQLLDYHLDEKSLNQANMVLSFKRPRKGFLKNLRPHPHIELKDHQGQYKAELQLVTPLGSIKISTPHVLNFSQNTFSLYIERSKGLVLPGDYIESLKIFRNNVSVLDTQGEVLQIDSVPKDKQFIPLYHLIIQVANHARGKQEKDPKKEERTSERIYLPSEHLAYIDGAHPLLPDFYIYGHLIDISRVGISFYIKKTKIPIIPGTIFENLHVQLPYQSRLVISIRILYCQVIPDDDQYSFRAGAEILNMSADVIKSISKLKQQTLDTRLFDASKEDQDELWEFFFETGFIYPDKRKQIQKFSQKLFSTQTKLLTSNSPIVKKIIFKENEEIKGHISSVKFFNHTWLVQHLTGGRSNSVESGRSVLSAMIEFFLDGKANQKVDTNFVTCFYRPSSIFPSILYGEAKKLIGNYGICDTIDYDFCLLSPNRNNKSTSPSSTSLHCERCTCDDDLRDLEILLIHQCPTLIRIEGLNIEDIYNLKVSEQFEKIGLYRYRNVFVVKNSEGHNLAFAVCNFSSPGINLSELTNSFKIYYSDPLSEKNEDIATCLAERVIDEYQKTEMPYPVLLRNQDVPIPKQFHIHKQYRQWFLDARFSPLFQKSVEIIFSNIKPLIKDFKRRMDNPDDDDFSNLDLSQRMEALNSEYIYRIRRGELLERL